MIWWGKLAGVALGYMLGGPLGALLGAALGHQFDRGLRLPQGVSGGILSGGGHARAQTAFFTATFSVLGHLAKSDGRVSEDEVQAARELMHQLGLNPEMKRLAIQLFTDGKQPHFRLDDVLKQFRRECGRHQTLIRFFVEIQLQAACADGSLHEREHHLLLHICEQLGVSRLEYQRMAQSVGATWSAQHPAAAAPVDSLAQAYAVLGITMDASDAEVTKAYRRLTSQHHPDRLVAKGLPEAMMKVATEKTQQIRAAYDQIRAARGL